LLAWAAAWALYAGGTHGMGWAAPWALLLATAWVAVAGVGAATPWRRVFIALGFPLSLLASGALAGVPAWAWLLPMVLLVALYPVRSWRDAPLFPTPAGALEGLLEAAPLWRGARVLDAGCGLGDGQRELQRVYPQARLTGLEWSWPLVWPVPGGCRTRGCGGAISGPRTGRLTTWCISSSAPRACAARRPRLRERCVPAHGW
jgi:hypothetical protein